LLADHFLDHYLNAHPQFPRKRISSEAKRSILTYAWPGNVRELKSAIERSVLLAEGEEITTDDLLLDLRAGLVPVPEGAEHMRPPSPQHRGAQRGIPAP